MGTSMTAAPFEPLVNTVAYLVRLSLTEKMVEDAENKGGFNEKWRTIPNTLLMFKGENDCS